MQTAVSKNKKFYLNRLQRQENFSGGSVVTAYFQVKYDN